MLALSHAEMMRFRLRTSDIGLGPRLREAAGSFGTAPLDTVGSRSITLDSARSRSIPLDPAIPRA
ncbi:hypothetical protein BE21_11490 [Sorangium cellulosum]|uniref:Uncharacterized protein n=1 Tax=Sorangium cellulosum TaxID=56 RepID=A0A150U0P7_SORCE|nr:hypothetical protein BE21_11490 [Sorangium cellulosum]